MVGKTWPGKLSKLTKNDIWKDPACYQWVNPRTKSPFSSSQTVKLPEGMSA